MATPKENISLGFSWVVGKLNALFALIPTKTSDLTNDGEDTNAPFVQEDGLKTVNGNSLIGSGNIVISGSGGGVESVTGDGVDNTDPANPVLSFPNLPPNLDISAKKWVIFGDSTSNSLTSDYPLTVIANLGFTGSVTHGVSNETIFDQITRLDTLISGDADYFLDFNICSLFIGYNDFEVQ